MGKKDIHATFHPGTAINVGDKLSIAFDAPKEADPVKVTLREVDAWVSNGANVQEGTGPPVLIVEFTGKIVGGKFQGKISQQGTSTNQSAPSVQLEFDGGTAQTIPLPDAALPNEDGIFEIQLEVTGTIKGKAASFTSPSPAFVRNFKAGKPVVAFITGSGQGFFVAADAFMHSYADGVFSSATTVLEIREFLRTQGEPRGFGEWGEANIVSHGNATEWVILPFAGAKSRHLRFWDVEDLRKDPRFQPGIAKQLPAGSRLVIRGCAIGNDQRLLDQIRALFGGQTTVFAPKFLQFYFTRAGVSRESFFEFFFFYAKAQTAPSDASCVAELKAKFPKAGISDAQWLKMLQNPNFDPAGFRASHDGNLDRHETVPWRVSITVDHPQRPRGRDGATPPEVQAAIQSIDFRARAEATFDAATPKENLETKFSDWLFVEGPLEEKPEGKTKTKFSKLFTGHRVRVEVRRELREPSGTPVRPDLNNNDHYGHSP